MIDGKEKPSDMARVYVTFWGRMKTDPLALMKVKFNSGELERDRSVPPLDKARD